MVSDGSFGLPDLSATQAVAVTTTNQSSITSNQQINLQVNANSPQDLLNKVAEMAKEGAAQGNKTLVNEINRGQT